MAIVVTGATGRLGGLVVDELLSRGVAASQITAGGRDGARLAALRQKGVFAVEMDYDDPDTVVRALDGAEKVLLVSSSAVGRRVAQHRAVVDAAVRAAVGQLVYTSALGADTGRLGALAVEHLETERLIAASGVPHTFLRNGWYSENYAPEVAEAARTGEIVAGVGDGRVASASIPDYAAAAAVVLQGDGHAGRSYELSGDSAWDYDELAAAVSAVIGRHVVYRRLDSEQQQRRLETMGVPSRAAAFAVARDESIRAGALDPITKELSALIGRPTTALIDTLRTLA